MKKLNFTKAAIESLVYLPIQYEVADLKINGLRLRVNPSKTKTFVLLKRVNNSVRRIKIARFGEISIEEVRSRAIRLLSQISDGIDPQVEKDKAKRY